VPFGSRTGLPSDEGLRIDPVTVARRQSVAPSQRGLEATCTTYAFLEALLTIAYAAEDVSASEKLAGSKIATFVLFLSRSATLVNPPIGTACPGCNENVTSVVISTMAASAREPRTIGENVDMLESPAIRGDTTAIATIWVVFPISRSRHRARLRRFALIA
jgi:hypothetical protein